MDNSSWLYNVPEPFDATERLVYGYGDGYGSGDGSGGSK